MTDPTEVYVTTRRSIREKTAELLAIRVDHNGNELPANTTTAVDLAPVAVQPADSTV